MAYKSALILLVLLVGCSVGPKEVPKYRLCPVCGHFALLKEINYTTSGIYECNEHTIHWRSDQPQPTKVEKKWPPNP